MFAQDFLNRAFKYQRIEKREEVVVTEKIASTLEIKILSILKTLDDEQKWKLKNIIKCFLIWNFISYNISLTLSTENKLPTFRRYFTTDCLPDPAAICSAVRPSWNIFQFFDFIFKNSDFQWNFLSRDYWHLTSNHTISLQNESNQIKSNQIKSNQIKSNQIKSNQIKSKQSKTNQGKARQFKS